MKEQWRTVPGFPNYKISSRGRVWSKLRTDSGNGKTGGLFLSVNKQGRVCLEGKHSFTPARLMLMAFVRLPMKGECALHRDDVNRHNDLRNLYWGSKKQNYEDAIRNGRAMLPKGKELSDRNWVWWRIGVYKNMERNFQSKEKDDGRRD